MREIKFRAFLKDSAIKKMNDSFIHSLVRMMDVQLIDFERRHVGFIRENGTFFFSFDDVELLEFTGLKDKNGMEIIEGDILGVDDPEDKSTAVVEYLPGSFRLKIGEGIYGHLIPKDSWLVIGNIFQNPDLLK